MKWSFSQEQALEVRNKNAIISAGAGSGKTAVLTERVFRIIKNKEAKVDELLVLTFTKSAAFEMKDRIIGLLRKDELYELADEVEGSNVTTFDAYALYIVKKYNYFFNINKDVSIIDDNIIKIKTYEFLDKLFEKYYEEKNPTFYSLISNFAVKNDEAIKDYVCDILDLADLKVDKEQFLNSHCLNTFSSTYLNELLESVVKLVKEKVNNALELCALFEDVDLAYEYEEFLNNLLEKESYDELYDAIKHKFTRRSKITDNDKKVRETIIKMILKPKIEKLKTSQDIKKLLFNEKYQEAYKCLFDIAIELNQKLENFKREKNSYTFQDIAKMAIKAVNDEQINKELKKKIKFIMVDEYQDTSDIQEAFINSIAKDNLFMVGDTKQAIYGFRNANCDLFQSKYENYKKGVGGVKIDLSENFRSRKPIVDDINKVFSKLMSKKIGAVDFKIDHIVKASNSEYDFNLSKEQNYNIEIYKYNQEDKKKSKAEYEAHLIAQDIVNKINNKYMVLEGKSLRPCTFKDFAIIVDKKKNFNVVEEVFANYKIPIKAFKSEDIFTSSVGNVFYNALTLIKKIQDEEEDIKFKHSLVALMRSFVYQESDNDIYQTVRQEQYDKTKAYRDIQEIAKATINLPLSEVVVNLYKTLDIYNKLVFIGNVLSNTIVLDKLLEVSKTMEELDYTLNDFIKYIDNLKEMQIDIDFELNDAMSDTVKLMTIHKSKGLGFSILYMPYLESDFYHSSNNRTSFKTSKDYNLIMPIIDGDSEKELSILKFLSDEKTKEETLSEKMRLFYVAITRVKEKVILLMDEKKENDVLHLSNANSLYDFVCYYQQNGREKLKETYVKDEETSLALCESDQIFNEICIKQPVKFEVKKDERVKASKEKMTSNEELLDFGNELHYLLELIDFKKKDLSFIKDKRMKKYMEKILSLYIFDNLENAKIFKEQHIYDEDLKVNGVIDLMIVYQDNIKIIDYKTKNIDDESYIRQLSIYKSYAEKMYHKPVRTYLLSIIDGKIKEVEHE